MRQAFLVEQHGYVVSPVVTVTVVTDESSNDSEQQSRKDDTRDWFRIHVVAEKDLKLDLTNLQTMLEQERTTYRSPSSVVSETWRIKIVEWCMQVADHFTFDRQVVSYAMNYLDRVAALKPQVGNKEYQRLAVSCLYLAIKLHGEMEDYEQGYYEERKKLSLSVYVELGRGLLTEELICATELEVLRMLRWRVNPPTSTCFLQSFLALLPPLNTVARSQLLDQARYLTDLAACVSIFDQASHTAFCALACAIETASCGLSPTNRVLCYKALHEATGYSNLDPSLRRRMTQLEQLEQETRIDTTHEASSPTSTATRCLTCDKRSSPY
jgi:hypothetical protein